MENLRPDTQIKNINIPEKIRPFRIGYQVVNEYGQPLALRNGSIVFDLPYLAEKAIEKEFKKNDPTFDIHKHSIEQVAIVELNKFYDFLTDGK